MLLKKKAYSFRIKEEKVSVGDLEFFNTKRTFEKSSKYLRNVKNKNCYAFHENGIWHNEKAFDFIFDIKEKETNNI